MINYRILNDSIEYYERHGFQRIESPWTVTKAISDITKPMDKSEFTIKEKNKVLVASGEQSFLYLANKGFLPKGKFLTVTPCFRDDPFDELHTKYFMKNELIITDNVCNNELRKMVNLARNFFRQYCLLPKENDGYLIDSKDKDDVKIINTVNEGNFIMPEIDPNENYQYQSYDLSYRGIELGSYGIRKCGFLHWIYGTGCSEPRLTRVLKTYGISYV